MNVLQENMDQTMAPKKLTILEVQFWEKDKVDSLLTQLKLAPGTAEYVELVQAQNGLVYKEEKILTRQPKIFLINSDQQVLSVYRSVLFEKKADLTNELDVIQRVTSAVKKTAWIILLIGGGNFAGAVFNGFEPIVHKTFHSYTVRKKQGGTQSSKDNRNNSHANSAGASLRRYNEKVHKQHIQEIISEWDEYIKACDLIFCRCPKSLQSILYGGKCPAFSKSDQRLRSIPFATKRATYAEVKRVHLQLSQITIHGKIDIVQKEIEDEVYHFLNPIHDMPIKSSPIRKGGKSTKKLSMDCKSSRDTKEIVGSSPESESEEECELVTNFETFSLNHLDPFGSTAEDERLKAVSKKKQTERYRREDDNRISNTEHLNKERNIVENAVYTSCRTGKLHELKALWEFSKKRDITEVSDTLTNEVIQSILLMENNPNFHAMKFGISEKTLLHVAAEKSHKEIIWWLLEQGCDPAIPNGKNETPFLVTTNKETRNHFRRYMAANPDQFNYEKAKIPGPLTKQMEMDAKTKLNLKKKEKKKAKLEKEAQLKIVKKLKEKELEEQKNFLALSDREKRALAAERRITVQKSQQNNCNSSPPMLRCFQCAKDISNLIPFEYLDFKFCSSTCVKEHRSKSKVS